MTATVTTDQIVAALKILQSANINGAIRAFESQDTLSKVEQGVMLVDDAAEVAGLFFPPVAVVANDVKIALTIEQIVKPFILYAASLPVEPIGANQILIWGQPMNKQGLFQAIGSWWSFKGKRT